MIVYRISKTRYANDLSGEGARLHGGRWNHKGTPCIYTSENRALAVLEYTVNVAIDDIPRALSMVVIDIPVDDMTTFAVSRLPGNWYETPVPAETKDFGAGILEARHSPIIKIPSAVIPEEFNYVLNPMHPDSRSFRIIQVTDFVYDIRIKKSG
jgi:RES domain-containing protein